MLYPSSVGGYDEYLPAQHWFVSVVMPTWHAHSVYISISEAVQISIDPQRPHNPNRNPWAQMKRSQLQ